MHAALMRLKVQQESSSGVRRHADVATDTSERISAMEIYRFADGSNYPSIVTVSHLLCRKTPGPRNGNTQMQSPEEHLSLYDAAVLVLEECRTILPGLQALFGFQLIAIFSPGFDEKLSAPEQLLHLAAIGLVAVAVVLIMAPAAYHRQTGPAKVNSEFLTVAGRAVLAALIALMLGLTLDFYIVATAILEHTAWATGLAALLCGFILLAWFLFPRMRKLHRDERSLKRR